MACNESCACWGTSFCSTHVLSSQVATDIVARVNEAFHVRVERLGTNCDVISPTPPLLSVLDYRYRCLGSKAFLIQSRGIFVYLKNESV